MTDDSEEVKSAPLSIRTIAEQQAGRAAAARNAAAIEAAEAARDKEAAIKAEQEKAATMTDEQRRLADEATLEALREAGASDEAIQTYLSGQQVAPAPAPAPVFPVATDPVKL